MIYKHLHFISDLLVDKHAVSVQIAFYFQLAPAGSYPVQGMQVSSTSTV